MVEHNAYEWRTSTFSSNGENCVEVAPTPRGAAIRHSRHPQAGMIELTHGEWLDFLSETRRGASPKHNGALVSLDDDGATVSSERTDVALKFDYGEWSAFIAGATAGEFNFS